MTTCQDRLINCNKLTTSCQRMLTGEWNGVLPGNSLFLELNFSVNLKLIKHKLH